MYLLSSRHEEGGKLRYRRTRQISLFGCKSGILPAMLKNVIPPGQGQPFAWHIPIEKGLSSIGIPDSAIVIDVKPDSRKEITLLELAEVWGYSCPQWTPILMKMRGLLVDRNPREHDRTEFASIDRESNPCVYSFLHLDGSVEKGKLTGRWNPPRPSSTNSALLWPDALSYFMNAIPCDGSIPEP